MVAKSSLAMESDPTELQSNGGSPSEPSRITPRLLMTGTLSTLVNRIFGLSIAFFLTPFVVHSVGVEAYGLWAVLGSAVGYFALLDGGVGSSFVKYLAEFLERREHDDVRQVMTFGCLFYLAFGLMMIPAAHLLGPRIVGYLQLDPRYRQAAIDLLMLVVTYFVVSSAFGILDAFIIAMQRTDLSGLLGSGSQIIYATSLVLMLRRGYGVYALPYAIFCALAVVTVVRFVIVYRMFGNPWCNPFKWKLQLIKRLFRFGFWMQINALTAVINLETDRVILGTYVSVLSAGYYELGNRLASLSRSLPAALLGPLLPAASALDGRNEVDRLDVIYVRGTRYLALATFVIAGFLIGAGPQIVRVWMGRTYPYVTIVMGLLLFSYLVNCLTGVGTMIVRATGQPYYETYYAVAGAVINVVATLILTPIFGLMGVIGGTVIGIVSSSLYFLWLFHKLRGFDWRSTIIEWLWRLTLGTMVTSAILWIACRQFPILWFTSRMTGVVTLGVLGAAYLAITFLLLWLLGFWSPADRALVEELAPKLFGPRLNQCGGGKS
jgi:O-antigen/teichoic acid export membrane protein